MKKYLMGFLKDEDGQGLMAYGLVILFVAVALISAVGLINGDFAELYLRFTTSTI